MREKRWAIISGPPIEAYEPFVYAVKTTGIYCRPFCKSRLPNKDNVEFFGSAHDAEQAGYRPCKRCRPDLIRYTPEQDTAQKVQRVIQRHYMDREALARALEELPMSQHRLVQVFRSQHGLSPAEYAERLRFEEAQKRLRNSQESILEIAFSLGFESLSAFYAFFKKHTEATPRQYRKKHQPFHLPLAHAWLRHETPFGPFIIASNKGALTLVQPAKSILVTHQSQPDAITDEAALQLTEYFAGKRQAFDLPLQPEGTAFQQSVWSALQGIAYGKTATYKEVAQKIGSPNASRAVGMANNKNPVLIIIPCHRVVGSNGALVGYAGGLVMKEGLLELERTFATSL